jgi:hypothetical protein
MLTVSIIRAMLLLQQQLLQLLVLLQIKSETFTIALMIKAVNTSETSVNFYQTTRRNIPKDSHLHTRRREDLKFHLTGMLTGVLA